MVAPSLPQSASLARTGLCLLATDCSFFPTPAFPFLISKATQICRKQFEKLIVYLDYPVGIHPSKQCSDRHGHLCGRLELDLLEGKTQAFQILIHRGLKIQYYIEHQRKKIYLHVILCSDFSLPLKAHTYLVTNLLDIQLLL